ncbi:Rieske 2Fe-2S domain-containing protein [Hydrogenophaga sp. BPS33]|uniref:Rieske 2Fe-2S domain-containing protein n=1 Tax=Hydrogenophaga sp. BPS33 TaxID=2651974 RepID=UPI00131F6B38|nr:Rieske 2Fe-2S domain-containing protein [Hydrogenophaga sp. BPS33]QHE85503.1 Rieske 2Fe-2S domain-containing protein [Hydrogenophaga sp. BPS33]
MNHEDNEALCRVGKGTPMGELLRRYWLPAGLSSDLPSPDSDPVRVRLLNQDLVAFRDSEGKVGILDELCPHRRASLVLGRVEQGGIQCIYHGWRFDVRGQILEMPNCDDEAVRSRYKATAYPVREAGGVIWTYLGEPEQCPVFPEHPWMAIPESHRYNRVMASHSNFVQVLEGLLDSSHLGVLHQDALPKPDGSNQFAHFGKTESFQSMTTSRAPRIEVEETDFGMYYAALRGGVHEGEPVLETRVTAFVAPFTVYVPFDTGRVALMVVPVDDEHTHFYNIQWDESRPLGEEPHRSAIDHAGGTRPDVAQWWGFSREAHGRPGTACRENNWLQDRVAMRQGKSFSGLPVFYAEDTAMTSSMGPISDRDEMLVPADVAIVRMRRLLLAAARRVQAGERPPAYADGQVAGDVVPIATRIRADGDWRELVRRTQADVEGA